MKSRGDPTLAMRFCQCGERVDGEVGTAVACGHCGAEVTMPHYAVGQPQPRGVDREDATDTVGGYGPRHDTREGTVTRKCPKCGRVWTTFPQWGECRRCNDGTVGVPVG